MGRNSVANATFSQVATATVANATVCGMSFDPQEQRRRRLSELAETRGGKTALGRLLGYRDGAYIGQLLRGERPINEKTLALWAERQPDIARQMVIGEAVSQGLPAGAIPVPPGKQREIVVVGKVAGGLPERIWNDGDQPIGATDRVGAVISTDPLAFLCEVTEDSMVPKYVPGDFALVEPGTEPELEDDVIVRLHTGETLLKRLLSRRNGYRFGSYNNSTVLSFPSEDVTWIYYVAYPVPRRKIKQRW